MEVGDSPSEDDTELLTEVYIIVLCELKWASLLMGSHFAKP